MLGAKQVAAQGTGRRHLGTAICGPDPKVENWPSPQLNWGQELKAFLSKRREFVAFSERPRITFGDSRISLGVFSLSSELLCWLKEGTEGTWELAWPNLAGSENERNTHSFGCPKKT